MALESKFSISNTLASDLLMDSAYAGDVEVYIKNVDRLTEELKGGLSVGEEYCLFTRYSVDTKIRTSLKSLKTALHKSFGDNGTDYYVLLREVDGRKDRIAVIIQKNK
jgi:hypothetical protein